MSDKTLAIVTMVYNEPDLLPVWKQYYSQQVGLDNCYVINHGCNDSSLESTSFANLINLPPSDLDENWRCDLVSGICSNLLSKYDYVAYTDVDEILVADPRHHWNLIEFCSSAEHDVTTAFGMDLLQVLPGEQAIQFEKKILQQRRWVRPFSSLCKPTLTRRPVKWGPGFHHADAPSYFDDLFLFHVAYVDFAIIERRQRKRVTVRRPSGHGGHHSIPPEIMVSHIANDYTTLPQLADVDLGCDCAVRASFVEQLFRDNQQAFGGPILSGGVQAAQIWQIPARFAGSF